MAQAAGAYHGMAVSPRARVLIQNFQVCHENKMKGRVFQPRLIKTGVGHGDGQVPGTGPADLPLFRVNDAVAVIEHPVHEKILPFAGPRCQAETRWSYERVPGEFAQKLCYKLKLKYPSDETV
ncbi:MAG: hypothetical protein SWC96_02400 [Thermodesulfobacteriota bacterium]|nr:hypothetical protein [Thermodesulfobacteriota bacterium]